jgi:hypothetical protein
MLVPGALLTVIALILVVIAKGEDYNDKRGIIADPATLF